MVGAWKRCGRDDGGIELGKEKSGKVEHEEGGKIGEGVEQGLR